MTVRLIPRLDIKGANLVKGIHLEGLRVLGKPERFARYYYEAAADELFFMDAVASLYGRNQLTDIIERVASEIFIPLVVGGGIRSVDDIRTVLRAGADKVSINTACLDRPSLITEASKAFGSSTILVTIEAGRDADGRYVCFTDCGRQATGVDAIEWAVRAAELGAGEICITAIDREGTGRGFDTELTRRVVEAVPIPVIAHGGAGSCAHIEAVISEGGADAVAVASMLHYRALSEIDWRSDSFADEGNIEFIRKGAAFGRFETTTLAEAKAALANEGVDVRTA